MVRKLTPHIIFEYEIEDRVGKTDILRTVKVTIAWKKIVMVRHSFTHSLFFLTIRDGNCSKIIVHC